MILILAASCGRVGFSARADSGRDASSDALADGGFPALVAYYPMEAIADGVVPDATGNGHDATCTGTGCPGLTTGRIGSGALVFDGIDDMLVTPGPASAFGSPTFTVAWWSRAFGSPENAWCPVNKVYGAGNQDSWESVINSDGSTSFVTAVMPSGNDDARPAAMNVGDGLWHHHAFTFDGTTKVVYVDGVQAKADVPASGVPFDDGAVAIGADLDSGTELCEYMGVLDDVRIYSIALDATAISALANAP